MRFLLLLSLNICLLLGVESTPVQVLACVDECLHVQGTVGGAPIIIRIELSYLDTAEARRTANLLYESRSLPEDRPSAQILSGEIKRQVPPGSWVILYADQPELFWSCLVYPLGDIDPSTWERPISLPPSLQETLIRSGHSPYWRYLSRAGNAHLALLSAEAEARQNQIGLWASNQASMESISAARATKEQELFDLDENRKKHP